MWLTPIEVECYAGSKADETPRRLRPGESRPWTEIIEVLDRWYEAGTHPEWPAADYFKVLGTDEHTYLIKRDLESDEWFLIRQW